MAKRAEKEAGLVSKNTCEVGVGCSRAGGRVLLMKVTDDLGTGGRGGQDHDYIRTGKYIGRSLGQAVTGTGEDG